MNIYYGIKTGLNEAFIIDTATRQRILDACKDDAERQRTEAIIKPILRGRDIKRYTYEWKGLWVIAIPAGWTNEHRGQESADAFIRRKMSSLMRYLSPFEAKARARDDQGDYWWELRPCAYYAEFEKEKVVWTPVNSEYSFAILPPGVYFVNSVFMITGSNLKYLCAIFNSKIIRYYLTFLFSSEEEYTYASKETMEKIPIPPITPENQSLVSQIEALVDQILARKRGNPHADTRDLERDIDQLVYRLYDLTPDEIRLVEGM